MADGSTTETIIITADASDATYVVHPTQGTIVSFEPSNGTIHSADWNSPIDILLLEVRRAAMQFVWPNTLTKSPEGSMLDPPVLASASLSLATAALPAFLGAPKITIWMALEPTVTLDSTIWPGPLMEPPGSLPDSGLTQHPFINVMPRINGNRDSVAVTAGINTLSLDAGQLSRIIDDQPGKTAWDLNFTFVIVVDDELLDLSTIVRVATISVAFADSQNAFAFLRPKLTVEHIPAHTGFMTNVTPTTPTRAVRDARFGTPSLSMDLVEDKYQPGIWVNPKHQDSDDGIVRYRKRPEHRSDNKPVR